MTESKLKITKRSQIKAEPSDYHSVRPSDKAAIDSGTATNLISKMFYWMFGVIGVHILSSLATATAALGGGVLLAIIWIFLLAWMLRDFIDWHVEIPKL